MHAELFNQAVMHHHAGALGDAERSYRQLLAVLPSNAEAHGRLGAVLMRQGKMADAISHIEHALSLRPDMFEAYGNLCSSLYVERTARSRDRGRLPRAGNGRDAAEQGVVRAMRPLRAIHRG